MALRYERDDALTHRDLSLVRVTPGIPAMATCTNIDECATDADSCDTNATCTDTPGGFTCACNTGYSGDGDMRTSMSALQTQIAAIRTRRALTHRAFTCACNAGYSGDGTTCTNIDGALRTQIAAIRTRRARYTGHSLVRATPGIPAMARRVRTSMSALQT